MEGRRKEKKEKKSMQVVINEFSKLVVGRGNKNYYQVWEFLDMQEILVNREIQSFWF